MQMPQNAKQALQQAARVGAAQMQQGAAQRNWTTEQWPAAKYAGSGLPHRPQMSNQWERQRLTRLRPTSPRHSNLMHHRLFCFLLLGLMNNLSVASGQQTVGQSAPKPSTEQEPLSSFQAINASIDTILMQYEQLTGKVLIKDSNLAANALPITISVPQPVPKGELVRLIEASLLLNNIVLVPAQEPNSVKVININTGKNPRSEGVRLFSGPESIPEGEQVISYYMPFKYISATEALTVFQTHILPRAYTSFVPINSAQALLITESTTVIRQLVALQQLIDIPPARTVAEFVPLVRADAERVADTIDKLMEYQRKARPGGEQGPAAWSARCRPTDLQWSCGGGDAGLLGGQAQVISDTRTNRILV